MAMMKTDIPEAIKTQRLSKYYGHMIGVSDLNLSIRQGEIFGFLGPNGAGKTTTIRLLLGLIRPTSGDVWISGKNTKRYQNDLSNSIGYLPGELGLYKDLSGYDYLQHFLKLRSGRRRFDSSNQLKTLMKRFDISFNKKISTYSKGMRQVIGIIQAFIHDPEVLILDEPTSGLDPFFQDTFYEFLLQEKKAGKTIFFSSHILHEVEKICDRAGMIKNGKLIDVKEMGEFRSDVVKRVTVIPQGELIPSSFRIKDLAGVKSTVIKKNEIEFVYSGNMQPLIQCMADIGIKDLLCEPLTLEEVFYEFYEEHGDDQR